MIGYITRETDLFLLSKAVMATKKIKSLWWIVRVKGG